MSRSATLLGCALATVAATAACSGGSGGSGTSDAVTSPAPVVTPTCPSIAPSASPTSPTVSKALRNIPFDLPMPDDITVVATRVTADGIRVVQFTTPTSMRDSVLFIVGKYPKAGYVLGRGDAEATEADAPFVRNGVRGLTRVASVDACRTMWLVASSTVKTGTGTSPLLSPHPTSSATSALPFG